MLLQRQLKAEDQQAIKSLLKQLALMPEAQADQDNKPNVRARPHDAHCSCAPLISWLH